MREREVSWLVWKKLVLVHEHLPFACSGVSVHFKKKSLFVLTSLIMVQIPKIPKSPDARFTDSQDFKIPRTQDSQILRFPDLKIPRFLRFSDHTQLAILETYFLSPSSTNKENF